MIPVRDEEIRLYHSSSGLTLVDYGTNATWPDVTAEAVSYGGASDMWERSWTAAQINSVHFGLSIRATMFGYPDPDIDRVGAIGRVTNAELSVTYCAE